MSISGDISSCRVSILNDGNLIDVKNAAASLRRLLRSCRGLLSIDHNYRPIGMDAFVRDVLNHLRQ